MYKMDQSVLNTILNTTYTLSELRKRVNILKNYLTLKLFGDIHEWGKVVNQFNPDEIAWLQSLEKSFLDSFNKDNVNPIFESIEKSLSQTNILNIYLPFETNSQINSSLGQNLRKLFDRIILLDVKFDPNLIAGCALSWQGIYRDYSLRKRIEDNKAQIMAGFKKYLK